MNCGNTNFNEEGNRNLSNFGTSTGFEVDDDDDDDDTFIKVSKL